LVGDSHLTDTSPRQVTKLGPRLRAAGFDVTTLAQGGLDTRQALIQTPPRDVDWVVYSFGTNDAAPWKQVPPDEFERNYARLLASAAGAAQLVLGPPPVVDRPGGRSNAAVREYSDIAARLSPAHGDILIALINHLSTSNLVEDGVHLNDLGYATVTQLLTETLNPAT
jgi:lysophospholipase L1-like esterase